MSLSDFPTIGLVVVVTIGYCVLLSSLIIQPIYNKYFYELSYEDIQKYPLRNSDRLIKKLIESEAVPNSAKRWLKIGLFLRMVARILVFSLILFLIGIFSLYFIAKAL
jgi:hypothetical protein